MAAQRTRREVIGVARQHAQTRAPPRPCRQHSTRIPSNARRGIFRLAITRYPFCVAFSRQRAQCAPRHRMRSYTPYEIRLGNPAPPLLHLHPAYACFCFLGRGFSRSISSSLSSSSLSSSSSSLSTSSPPACPRKYSIASGNTSFAIVTPICVAVAYQHRHFKRLFEANSHRTGPAQPRRS